MISKGSIKLLVGRISIAGVIYLSLLGLASLLGPEKYGDIAFTIFIIKSLALCGIGVSQGFIFYSLKKDNNHLIRSYAFFMILMAFVYILVFVIFFDIGYFEIYVVIFILVLIEPFLKVNNNYYAVLYPELVLTLSYLGVAFFEGEERYYLLLLSLFLVVILLVVDFKLMIVFFSGVFNSSFKFRMILKLIARGFPALLFNFSFFLFLLIDRYFISLNYSHETLGVVMLAYQLSLATGFLIVSLNSKLVVEVGLIWHDENVAIRPILLSKINKMFMLSTLLILMVTLCIYGASDMFFSEYDGLLLYYLVFSVGLMFFNLYGTVAPVLFYVGKQRLPVFIIFISLVFIVNLHSLDVFSKLDLLIIETLNYMMLSFMMMFLIGYSFSVMKMRDSSLVVKVLN